MILLELSFIMDKRKTGIALFITLMVIASIMSIIAVSFTYLEKVQKSAGTTSALIQANIFYGNTVAILKKFFPTGSDNREKLELIYSMPLILNDDQSEFSVTLSCQALMSGVPINWLDNKQTKKNPEQETLANEVLKNVMELYQIENTNALQELLLEEITGVSSQNNNYKPRLKKQKGINSKQQFNKLILDYTLKYDDDHALAVPWEKYFSFLPVTTQTRIDGVFLSPEFISVAFDIPLEVVQSEWIIGESTLSTFLQNSGVVATINKKIYANKALNAMHCEERFLYQEKQYEFKFNYIEGRSNNFEFNGQK